MIACFKIFATGRLAIPFAMSTTANRGCFQKKKETQEVIAHTSLMSIASLKARCIRRPSPGRFSGAIRCARKHVQRTSSM